jgi:hypothetical protein
MPVYFTPSSGFAERTCLRTCFSRDGLEAGWLSLTSGPRTKTSPKTRVVVPYYPSTAHSTVVVSSNPKQDRHYPLLSSSSSSPRHHLPISIAAAPVLPSSPSPPPDGLLPLPSIRSLCLLGTFLLQSPSRRPLCADGFCNLVQFRYLLPEISIPPGCSRVPGCASWVIFFAIRMVSLQV